MLDKQEQPIMPCAFCGEYHPETHAYIVSHDGVGEEPYKQWICDPCRVRWAEEIYVDVVPIVDREHIMDYWT